MHPSLQQLRDYCDAANAPLVAPPDAETVQSVFASLDYRVTPDVLAFFLAIGGTEFGDCDDHMLSLWCLDRVYNENQQRLHDDWPFLWFGDWLISSHHYALRPHDDVRSAVYIDYQCNRTTAPEWLADDMYDFATMLASDPASSGVIL